MPSTQAEIVLAPAAAPDIKTLLGPPPLLEGEDPAAYDALYERVKTAVEPGDALEAIWARDVVDLIWETLRLRRLKVKFLNAYAHEGVERLLDGIFDFSNRSVLAQGWAQKDKATVKHVLALLKQVGHDQESIAASTLAIKLQTIERIDIMIARAEARRNAVLREVERHRDALAKRLHESAKAIEDAEFREIPAQEAAE